MFLNFISRPDNLKKCGICAKIVMWITCYEHSLGLLDKYVHYILNVTLCGDNDVMLRSEGDWVKKG